MAKAVIEEVDILRDRLAQIRGRKLPTQWQVVLEAMKSDVQIAGKNISIAVCAPKKPQTGYALFRIEHYEKMQQKYGRHHEIGFYNKIISEWWQDCNKDEWKTKASVAKKKYKNELAKLEMTFGSGDEIEKTSEDCGSQCDGNDNTYGVEINPKITLAAYQNQSQSGSQCDGNDNTYGVEINPKITLAAFQNQSQSVIDTINGIFGKMFDEENGKSIGVVEKHTVFLVDYMSLEKGVHLTDNVIDPYIVYIKREKLTIEQQENSHIFSIFFYNTLVCTIGDSGAERHSRVQHWTQEVNIFDKDFVVFSICEGAHWFLAIVCYPAMKEVANDTDGRAIKQSCILILDSSKYEPRATKVAHEIRDYLTYEYAAKFTGHMRVFTRQTMPVDIVDVPQQNNSYDCGVFLLETLEHFFKYPIKTFELPIEHTWYDVEKPSDKRTQLAEFYQNQLKGVTLPAIELPTKK